ncbi:hypothetical protein BZA70DRAFT_281125 [Myxozyma melibiosi]|uniref:Secreted protein n=1 Tax=Myxozyma melibiosi TaxID=54550 RepID=A0ABR1F632_9ASCO
MSRPIILAIASSSRLSAPLLSAPFTAFHLWLLSSSALSRQILSFLFCNRPSMPDIHKFKPISFTLCITREH